MSVKTVTLSLLLVLCFASFAEAKPDRYFQAAQNDLSFREAESYPVQKTNRDITIGLEALNKDHMKRLLGNDTGKYKMFDVAVTNNSNFRIYLNQIDLKTQDGATLPRVDLSEIVKAIDPGGKGNKDDMREAVLRTNILGKSLSHSVLNPGETLQGLVFIKDSKLSSGTQLFIQIQNLKRVAYLDFLVPLKP